MKNNKFTIYLSLGSNLGDRYSNLKEAITGLHKEIDVKQLSSVYETEPVGASDKRYLNMVIKATTNQTPYELLESIHYIEASMGRNRSKEFIWGDRTMDIDILMYENLMMNDYRISLPHKEMFNRIFVLEPLNEICKDMIVYEKNITEILKKLKSEKSYFIEKFGKI